MYCQVSEIVFLNVVKNINTISAGQPKSIILCYDLNYKTAQIKCTARAPAGRMLEYKHFVTLLAQNQSKLSHLTDWYI